MEEIIDYTVLQKIIAKVEVYLLDDIKENYTEDSISKLQKNVDKAIELLKNTTTQNDVDSMVKEVQSFINNLEKKANRTIILK